MTDFNEPNISDYYNEQPHMVNVIDKMNEELSIVQQENESLKERIKLLECMDKQRNPVKILIEGKDIKKYIIEGEIFEDKLTELLSKSKKINNYDECEFDIKHLFSHLDDYIELLMKYTKQSKEWCNYRIQTCFKEYIPLKIVDNYWMDSLLKDDKICNDIIERIHYYLIVGENDDDEIEYDSGSSIFIHDIFIVKCDICHKYLPRIHDFDYDENTKLTKCFSCQDDY